MQRHNRTARAALIGLACVGLATAVAACGGSSNKSKGSGGSTSGGTTTVNVGVLPIADVAPLYIGIKQGFFSKQHLKVVPHPLAGGAAVASAVVGGSLQFGFGATANLVEARSHGLPIQFVANGDQAAASAAKAWSGIVVGHGSSITSVKQLDGKSVAANATKGENELALDGILQRAGLSPTSVHVVVSGFPDMPAAVESGKVDAVTEVEPFVSAIKAKGGTVVTPLFEGWQPSMIVAGYFANTSEISKDPALVKRFVTAMNQSLAYAQSHPADVRKVIPGYTSIPASVAAKMNLPVWSPTIDAKSITSQQALMVKLHWISKPVAIDDLLWSGAKR
jgi:NitT/TauT family transport system substrate-binding protein